MSDVHEVEIVVAHAERATLRVVDVFLKVDADQARADVEVGAMALAPIPTPTVLWRNPPVLALAALPGTALGRAVGDVVAGVLDRSEAARGDAHYDLAVLTLGHEERLDDVVTGYGRGRRHRGDPRLVVAAQPARGSAG